VVGQEDAILGIATDMAAAPERPEYHRPALSVTHGRTRFRACANAVDLAFDGASLVAGLGPM
jgi:hypothetical protein